MSNSHGSLENIILNAIWYIEENKLNSDKKTQNNQNINDITAPLTSQTENLEFNTQISA